MGRHLITGSKQDERFRKIFARYSKEIPIDEEELGTEDVIHSTHDAPRRKTC